MWFYCGVLPKVFSPNAPFIKPRSLRHTCIHNCKVYVVACSKLYTLDVKGHMYFHKAGAGERWRWERIGACCECLLARRVRQKHLYVYQGLLPTLFPLWVISLHQAMGSACHITLYSTNRTPACLSRTHTCTHSPPPFFYNSHVVVAPTCETQYDRGY